MKRVCSPSKSIAIFLCQSSDKDLIFSGQASMIEYQLKIICKTKRIFYCKILSMPFMIYTIFPGTSSLSSCQELRSGTLPLTFHSFVKMSNLPITLNKCHIFKDSMPYWMDAEELISDGYNIGKYLILMDSIGGFL